MLRNKPFSIGLIGLVSFTFFVGQKCAFAEKAEMYSLNQVHLLESPFTKAVEANREYLLALDPDRLLAPFLKDADLPKKAEFYGNWEEQGLAGHTAGHYMSALSDMIASGNDTVDGELNRRLDYMLNELERCQKANGNGYVGGVPNGHKIWSEVAAGNINAHGFGLNGGWVPLYNIHKTFAGLRDAYHIAGKEQALQILVKLGDWCYDLTHRLDDMQMQDMLRSEHGSMNDVLADLYAYTGDEKYLNLAIRFNHHSVLNPIMKHEDHLTGMHANTQIPKVIGLARIASLIGNEQMESGADFFWHNVTQERSVAFGGNSVSEHFNDPDNFYGMVETREGPETCNTYNMLRLTELLFAQNPQGIYADYYEEALYNHLLASINPEHPGYVYFTPIRPDHYRVYSQPEEGFWCCVGTGMENPGKYGQFIYAKHGDGGVYVNLFIPSELQFAKGKLVQKTQFPYEPESLFELSLKSDQIFTLSIRHPKWISESEFKIYINGQEYPVASKPSSYVAINRTWSDGDTVEVMLPMHITTERLPDDSDWIAFKYGPIVLANPAGTDHLDGLRADDSRMGHVAQGPLVPLNKAPLLIGNDDDLPNHISAKGQGLEFLLEDVAEPKSVDGLLLKPFYEIHDQRYQMYWHVLSREALASYKKRIEQEELKRAALEAITIDSVAIGEQQPEVEHGFVGKNTQSSLAHGKHWRSGEFFQYTLDSKGEQSIVLSVSFWGGDSGRTFDILVNDSVLDTITLTASQPGEFIEIKYPISSDVLKNSLNGKLKVAFKGQGTRTGSVYDLRIVKKR